MTIQPTGHRILPRLIRFRDAPDYLGMDRNRFNQEVRPYITEIPIGRQGKAFDRLELDAWADRYIDCNGRPGRLAGGRPRSSILRKGSESMRRSSSGEFEKALAKLSLEKRKNKL